MAKQPAALARYQAQRSAPQQIVVRMPSTPTRRRAAGGYTLAPPKKKRRSGSRRGSRRGKGMSMSLGKQMATVALASGLIGLLEKSGLLASLPNIPLIGTKGTFALGAWAVHNFVGGGEIVKDIAIAATALATYQLGKEGQITGDY